jgi:molybdate transport system substrate-binding protein
VFGCFASLALLGCSKSAPSGGSPERPLLIFAASSATDAIEVLQPEFAKSGTSGETRTNFAASSTLAQQIKSGADAAVFLSANERWGDELSQAGLVLERCNLLSNTLVVVAPKDSTLELKDLTGLDGEAIKHLALGDPESVPAGQYARQALENQQLWDKVKPKVVAASDVRQALTFVENGAAEAGIVFATDARSSPHVKIVLEIEPSLTEPIRYPLLLLKQTPPHSGAKALYEFLRGPTAAEVFRKHGFIVLEPTAGTSAAPTTQPAPAP